MSSASVTSSKREKETADLVQELESVRAMNNGLRSYLEHIRTFKENLQGVHKNCKQLNKINSQWIDVLSHTQTDASSNQNV
ncbi:hypothetical protein JYU34_000945 [Plutella xylostella]|uniref:Uncharacterized protein n=1 Tax=Plutella xylostella TaxID=51655 RepID=A0ABQ7R5V8_PLUXY|nr:uncharacterized protein LOC105387179 [Plutella xylostella]KAG7312628.1 hypothetical protein JYU34_000945 [Plutella xylostella]